MFIQDVLICNTQVLIADGHIYVTHFVSDHINKYFLALADKTAQNSASSLLSLAVRIPTEPVEAATGYGHDLNRSLSNEFCKRRCKPVGRTVFLERSAELVAQRTLLHYFRKEEAVLPHNGKKGCNTPRVLQTPNFKRGQAEKEAAASPLILPVLSWNNSFIVCIRATCWSPVGPERVAELFLESFHSFFPPFLPLAKWGVDTPMYSCCSLSWSQPVKWPKPTSQVDANLFRRPCSFGRCSAFHCFRYSAVSREDNMLLRASCNGSHCRKLFEMLGREDNAPQHMLRQWEAPPCRPMESHSIY